MFEVVVLVDSTGDYAVGKDQESAIAQYEEQVQELDDSGGHRFVMLALDVPLPAVTEVAATVPAVGKPVVTVK